MVATLAYLGTSLILLGQGVPPRATNLAAFGVGTVTSYCGHYFFTYRADDSHLKLGARFFLVTNGLIALGVVLHAAALALGASGRQAAFVVTFAYPPLSFALNHFWAFARGAVRRG